MKLEALATRLATNHATELEARLRSRVESMLAVSAMRLDRSQTAPILMVQLPSDEERAVAVKLMLDADRVIRKMASKASRGALGLHAEVEGTLVAVGVRTNGLKQRVKKIIPSDSATPYVAHAASLAVSDAIAAATRMTAMVYDRRQYPGGRALEKGK